MSLKSTLKSTSKCLLTKAKSLSLLALRAALYGSVALAALLLILPHLIKNDLITNSVKITNFAKNSGGSGTILHSSSHLSTILTNAHVCKVAEHGGMVTNTYGKEFEVDSYKISETQDLCLITVLGDFGTYTLVANRPPEAYYENAQVSGHPELLPTVITKGHFSGSATISVMIGVKACTQQDFEAPETGMICALLGGFPILKHYDSQLVTATIMPGSSGSGVYDKNLNLAGVVFAGSHDLGYAWIVPFESVKQFLDVEQFELKAEKPDNQVVMFQNKEQNSFNVHEYQKKMQEMCSGLLGDLLGKVCDSYRKDLIWYK